MTVTIHTGDAAAVLATLPPESAHCCVTSPPYWGLRDYGVDGQLGLESTPEEYVAKMVDLFRCVRRVLKDDGTIWVNLGDSYAMDSKWGGSSSNKNEKKQGYHRPGGRGGCGLPDKNLIGIPWRVAFALRADGWTLRSDIIWHKPNPMPESVTDRPTKAHEYLFLLAKSRRYYYDSAAVREAQSESTIARFGGGNAQRKSGKAYRKDRRVALSNELLAGRNIRSVWTVPTHSFPGAHFATFPPKLIEPCIKAGCPVGGTVLDPFGGAGTTGLVADRLGRNAVLITDAPIQIERLERARLTAEVDDLKRQRRNLKAQRRPGPLQSRHVR